MARRSQEVDVDHLRGSTALFAARYDQTCVADRKRLPVLKNTPEEEQGEEPRPPWHWVGFGTTAIMAAWVPLTYVGTALAQRWIRLRLPIGSQEADVAQALAALPPGDRATFVAVQIGLPALGMTIGAVFGGYVVGRWGGDSATSREAAIAGFAAALIAAVLTFAGGGFAWPVLVFVALSTAAAWAGGGWGMRARLRSMIPNMRM
jgi:hypothetical protein